MIVINIIRKVISILIISMILTTTAFANNQSKVYVIPIKGEINKAVTEYVKANIQKAEKDPSATTIIFEIDTLGGFVDEAVKIKDLIIGSNLDTVAFVNKKAESAGVLLTISCDKILMAKGATIGSAETIPYNEKGLSYWKGELRAVAEQKNRDTKLVEAMAEKRSEIVDEDTGKYIVKEGELLNLTSGEALNLKLIDGIANNYNEGLKLIGIDFYDIIIIEENMNLKIAQFVSNSYIAVFLLILGFVGIVIEIMTPGFGIGGFLGIIGFFTFFFGKNLSGDSNMLIVSIFLLGIILFIVEVLVPGFGIFGISGIVLIIASIVLSFNSIMVGVYSLIVSFVLCIIVGILLFKYGQRSKYLNKIILDKNLELKNKEEYIDHLAILNKTGIVLTTLRPAGSIQIEENRFDAITQGDFIPVGEKIKVVKVIGKKIIVQKIKED